MKNCGTCRFKGAVRSDAPRYSICHRIEFLPDADYMKDPAAVMDGSGYSASLAVQDHFLCSLHEDREEPT